jgi:hypothetical protein
MFIAVITFYLSHFSQRTAIPEEIELEAGATIVAHGKVFKEYRNTGPKIQ